MKDTSASNMLLLRLLNSTDRLSGYLGTQGLIHFALVVTFFSFCMCFGMNFLMSIVALDFSVKQQNNPKEEID